MKQAIQICGTGSDVGKSVLVTALCRIFLQGGYSVCPFKAQNMSLNSFVTRRGGEMGRAQVVQAQAAKIEPDVDMNPVLIKPTSDTVAQIILQGRPVGNMSAREYQNSQYKLKLFKSVKESLERLKQRYEILIIEGAGSPAEINLKEHDFVNMKMAEYADASVILVGDIDKGGVFASFIGTLELLSQSERKRIKGFIINKFRGDKRLLQGGIRFLERRTKKPVLGVIPYFKDIRIPQEDSVALDHQPRTANRKPLTETVSIAVIKLPHMSNFTDFDALEYEPDVRLSYVDNKEQLSGQDVIIIPGTKNTIEDLQWLRHTGIADKILSSLYSLLSTSIIGICGGYQMLGQKIYDKSKVESSQKEINGLGILPIVTNFRHSKRLSQIKAIDINSDLEITGYEIHHGITDTQNTPVFKIIKRHGRETECLDGTMSADKRVWGTYIHGVFDADGFRRNFLNRIRAQKGLSALSSTTVINLDEEFDKLADLVRKNINMRLLYKILNDGL